MSGIGEFAGARMALTPVTADDGTTIYQLQTTGSGGTGGGGPATIADGADVAEGATTAPAATSFGIASWSVIALLKAIGAKLVNGTLTVQSTSNAPTAGTNLSGTATTTSGGFNLAALTTRKPGDVQGQNISAVSIGFNEFGGTAAIGTAGTYTVAAGGTFSITTNQLVNFIAASGTAAITITSV